MPARACLRPLSVVPGSLANFKIGTITLPKHVYLAGNGTSQTQGTALWTGGKGTYCTTQQEDNATYMALTRGANSGLVDLNRVAVLRTASNFDRPYPGESAWHSLCGCGPEGGSGGFVPAISNLWAASAPFIKDVVAHWDKWKHGVPK